MTLSRTPARLLMVGLLLVVGLVLAACPDESEQDVGAPKASDDSYSVDQGSVLTVAAATGLLANDKGKDRRCVGGTFTTNQGGAVVIASDGSFVYTPTALFSGLDLFAYKVKNDGGEDIGVVQITVNPTLPIATDDAYTTLAGVVLNQAAPGILANDVVNGGTITAPALDPAVITTTQNGSLLLRADGSFDYTPPAAFTGNDTFSYTLTNMFGADTSTVTIEVRQAPTAVNDPGYMMAPQSTLVVPDGATDLLANDAPGFPAGTLTSFGGGNLGGVVTSNLAGATVTVGNGSLTVNANGSFTFTPDTAFGGNFTFLYRLENAAGFSDATVTINVDPNPTAVDDPGYLATTGVVLNVNAATGLLTNDSLGLPTAAIDFFGGGSLGGIVNNPVGAPVTFGTGSLTVNADGSFSYTSDTAFTGNFTFDYQLSNTASSSLATVTIGVQQAPVAVNDNIPTLINTTLTRNAAAGLLSNDMSAVAASLTGFGAGNLGGTVTDNNPGTTVFFGVGSLTVNADGSFSFTPDNNFTGNFTFDYRIDNGFGFDDATVTIPVQQAPAATDDGNTATSGTPLVVGAPGLLSNDALGFPPATVLSFGGGSLGGAVTDNASGATVTFTGGDITVNTDGSYILNTTTFFGVFTFDYRVGNVIANDDATVTLTVQRVPTAANDSYSTAPGVTLTRAAGAGLLLNDILGQPTATLTSFGGGGAGGTVTTNAAGATITPIPSFSDGSLTVGADGSFTFVPATGQNGSFSFFYRLTNTQGTSDAQVDISLTLAPTFTSANSTVFTVGQLGSFPIAATGIPQTGMTITHTSGSLPTGVTFTDLGNGNATLGGTPAATNTHTYNLQFTADNGVNPPAVQSFTLTVNEAPTFTSTNNTTFTVGTPGNFGFTADGFPTSFVYTSTGTALPSGVSISGSNLTGTPAAGTGGVYNTLQFTVDNTVSPAGTQNFTLTINEAPTANDDNPGALYTLTLGGTLARGAGDLFNNNGAGADVLGFPAATIVSFGPSTGLETAAGNAGSTSGGTGLTVNANGSFSYTPVASGVHTFIYRLQNAAGSDTAIVTITVNEAPDAVNDPTGGIPGASSPGSTPFHISMNGSIASGTSPNLLANDTVGFPAAALVSFGPNTGAETTVASASNGTSAAGGVVRVFANGTFNYTPPSATFTGLDSFRYTLTNTVGSDVGVVSLAVGIRPAATGETYTPTVLGNIPVNTNTGTTFSVLTNDTGDSLTLNLVSTSSGTTIFNANGTFTYTPARGFSGAVTVTYNVSNGFGASSNVTLNVTVGTPVWFINNALGAAGDGTFNTPYNTLALFATANALGTAGNPANGDSIFVFSSGTAYTGSLNLRNTQRLIGQGTSLTFDAATGLTLPAHSTAIVTNTGTVTLNSALTLGSGNHLYGFALGSVAATSITGTNFGTLTSSGVTINNPAGSAMNLDTGALSTITFASVTSGGGTNNIRLVSVTGALTVPAGALTAATGTSVHVQAGTATLSIACTVSKSTAGRLIIVESRSSGSVTFSGNLSSTGTSTGILVQNNTGGTVTFSGGTKTINTGTAAGVTLTSNTGATVNFTGGGLAVTTTSGAGFTATGGGTVTVQGANNTISSTTGTALNIAATIGAGNITLHSINRSGGSAAAILLSGTGSGTFTVTGTGSTVGSGGTIQNITGADAMRLSSTGGLVALSNMVIQDIAAATDSTDAINTRSGFDAIHGQNVNGGLALTNVQIRRISDSAINGSDFANLDGLTAWNGLSLINCTLELSNRFHVANRGDAEQEGLVRIMGMSGIVTVTNTVFQNGARGLLFHTAMSGTLNITVQNSDFLTINREFTSGGLYSVGYCGIEVFHQGAINATMVVGDQNESSSALGNTFLNNRIASISVQQQPGTTGNFLTYISQNSFTVNDHLTDHQGPGSFAFDFPQGGVLLRATASTMQGRFSFNTFDQCMHANGAVGQLGLITDAGATSDFLVRNNTFGGPWDFPAELRVDGAGSFSRIQFNNNIYPFTLLSAAQLANTDIAGLPNQPLPYEGFFVDARNNGRMDLTMQNETYPDHDRAGNLWRDFSFYFRANTGATLNLELDNMFATNGFEFDVLGGGVLNLFRDGSAAGTAQLVMQANGNRGGGVNPNTNPPTVNIPNGAVTLSNTDPTLPTIP